MTREERAWFLTWDACITVDLQLLPGTIVDSQSYDRAIVCKGRGIEHEHTPLYLYRYLRHMQTSSGKQALYSHEHSGMQERAKKFNKKKPKQNKLCSANLIQTANSKFIRAELIAVVCAPSLQIQVFKQDWPAFSRMQITWSHQIRKQPRYSSPCNIHLQSAFVSMFSIPCASIRMWIKPKVQLQRLGTRQSRQALKRIITDRKHQRLEPRHSF